MIIGHMSEGKEEEYGSVMKSFAGWCKDYHSQLNVSWTNTDVNFKKSAPPFIRGTDAECTSVTC